jgi:oligopeptide/dipeptide ABC transporter ATP-binding protein
MLSNCWREKAELLLEVQGLKTSFHTPEGVVRAVNEVSFNVGQGETVGIVGESGSGKSVCALSIMGLVSQPGVIEGGRVTLEGRDLLGLSEGEMRQVRGRRISMVFQDPMTSLNPVLTIERQMTESMEMHLGLSRRDARNRAVELLERVGIADAACRIKEYPHTFSGGMRQRVMIAVAMSCEPALIIADEATSSVDVTIQAQILELLKGLATESGTALIIITHNMGIIARYVERVAIMYAGKIVEQGPVSSIFNNASHPYTLGLLRSVARIDRPRLSRLESIEGQPPDLAHLPAGCAFRERCGYALDRCERETPPFMEVQRGHQSACWEAAALAGGGRGRER